uniref:C2H2 type zinc finger protein n=1 Tax=Marseillevirus LCMAC101 TaxID=2506602 RepID=A0A481YSZ2_9VIRU|nr:MAG: C2H2 type zinc finger protein [Marseillevirus LCMAC101]
MNTCKYCDKNFATAGSLKRHIETSKTCLSNRGVKLDLEECQHCSATFTQKASLKLHYNRCPQRREERQKKKEKYLRVEITEWKKRCKTLENEVKESKEEIEELKEELSEQKGVVSGMKNAPGKTYNAYIHPKLVNLPINNIPALTQEYMIEKVNDGILTYEKAARGYPGILEVIGELITHENDDGIVERNYVCTDVSRNSFHRLLESKKWKSDKGGRYLNNMLDTFRDVMQEYKDKVYDLYKETPHESIEWDQVNWERKNISILYGGIVSNEGTSDREELVNILRKEISKRASV